MRFTKMEGAGNDYIYVDLFEEEVPDPAAAARVLSDRRFGVGGDGLVLIGPSVRADVSMRVFNADGSEAQMCGNGIRCVAKYVRDRRRVAGDVVTVETGVGVLSVRVRFGCDGKVVSGEVEMGRPRLARREIPVLGGGDRAIEEPVEVGDRTLRLTAVSMGNPHAVVFVEDVAKYPVAEVGPLLERHPLFPERTNVEFVQVLSRREVRQRTWERGSGETHACGTGASAVCVAGVLTGRTDRSLRVHLLGGDLEITWREDDMVVKSGPAREVFEGTIQPTAFSLQASEEPTTPSSTRLR